MVNMRPLHYYCDGEPIEKIVLFINNSPIY